MSSYHESREKLPPDRIDLESPLIGTPESNNNEAAILVYGRLITLLRQIYKDDVDAGCTNCWVMKLDEDPFFGLRRSDVSIGQIEDRAWECIRRILKAASKTCTGQIITPPETVELTSFEIEAHTTPAKTKPTRLHRFMEQLGIVSASSETPLHQVVQEPEVPVVAFVHQPRCGQDAGS